MAKKSMIARDVKRDKLQAKHASMRAEMKAAGDLEGLHGLPKNSSPSRAKNRCAMCSRPRSYMREFGLCRICFRTNASQGNIPGVTKASW